MKCYIIDDEPYARKGIKELVESTPNLDFIGESSNPIEALEEFREVTPDILFLDIQMPYMSGISFIKNFTITSKIVFTTAYSDYAIEAINLNVSNYLLKPIKEEQFLETVSKIIFDENQKKQANLPQNESIFLKHNGQYLKFNIQDILYVKAIQNYIKIYFEGSHIICHRTLSSLEEILPDCFFRVQRSYLVNINKISSFENNVLYINKHVVPISRQLTSTVRQIIMNSAIVF